MRRGIKPFVFLSVIWAAAGAAVAQDTGAQSNRNWETASIWTGGTVPNSSNNVYIGSTSPAGSAATATVTLTANESASNVYLGNGSGTNGTLDLGGNTPTITNNLIIGQSSGKGTLNDGGGSFTAGTVDVENGNSLTFGAKEVTANLNLSGGSGTSAGRIRRAPATGSARSTP